MIHIFALSDLLVFSGFRFANSGERNMCDAFLQLLFKQNYVFNLSIATNFNLCVMLGSYL